jgi:hypothetical protein
LDTAQSIEVLVAFGSKFVALEVLFDATTWFATFIVRRVICISVVSVRRSVVTSLGLR